MILLRFPRDFTFLFSKITIYFIEVFFSPRTSNILFLLLADHLPLCVTDR